MQHVDDGLHVVIPTQVSAEAYIPDSLIGKIIVKAIPAGEGAKNILQAFVPEEEVPFMPCHKLFRINGMYRQFMRFPVVYDLFSGSDTGPIHFQRTAFQCNLHQVFVRIGMYVEGSPQHLQPFVSQLNDERMFAVFGYFKISFALKLHQTLLATESQGMSQRTLGIHEDFCPFAQGDVVFHALQRPDLVVDKCVGDIFLRKELDSVRFLDDLNAFQFVVDTFAVGI